LRISNSLFAEDVIRSAGASSVASKWTTLMASWLFSTSVSQVDGSARTTLEKVPLPRDFRFMYCFGRYSH
jgi:hypothetical protein